MEEAKKAQEFVGQLAGKAVETLTVWTDANQRVLRELIELSATSAKEGLRLYAELQQGTLDAVRDSQATALRWQNTWVNGAVDPVQLYQRSLTETVENAQKAFRLLEDGAQAFTRSAERLQSTAEQTGKHIQETWTAVVSKMKETYAQN